jgi:hypothetical protein
LVSYVDKEAESRLVQRLSEIIPGAGFIAEELDELESLKVFVNYLPQEDGSKIPDGIQYGEMISALVSAIKHQDQLIQSLTARVELLENS